MKTTGSLLKSRRVQAKLTLTQLSGLTKIPVTTLLALEKNRFKDLPAAPYIQGFIQNYSRAVGLDPEQAISAFKRDFNYLKSKKVLPSGLVKPLNTSFNYRLALLGLVVLLPLTYLAVIVYNLFQPPALIVIKPQEGEEVKLPILIKGKTDRDATLTLNNQTVNLEPDGSFTTVANTAQLKFVAISRRGKSRELIRHVIITP
jgi:transcriptional regulator with XRE-family HTH domain